MRKQVCKRLQRRIRELGLDSAKAYREYLRAHPAELRVAAHQCRITISRFNRDRAVFVYLADQVLPELGFQALTAGATTLKAWSAGCASGEEPYTLALIWHFLAARRLPELDLRILGTDIDETLLGRAKRACYPRGSLREIPEAWVASAFEDTELGYRLRSTITNFVSFERHDLRSGPPNRRFDLVLCRNLAFTYFDDELQSATARSLRRSLRDGGALVLGARETLPESAAGFAVWSSPYAVYRKVADPSARL